MTCDTRVTTSASSSLRSRVDPSATPMSSRARTLARSCSSCSLSNDKSLGSDTPTFTDTVRVSHVLAPPPTIPGGLVALAHLDLVSGLHLDGRSRDDRGARLRANIQNED